MEDGHRPTPRGGKAAFFSPAGCGGGGITGLLTVGYYHLVHLLQGLCASHGGHPSVHNLYFLLAPLGGGLIIGILNLAFTSEARSSYGIPGVIEAVTLRGGKIKPQVALVRSLNAAICIAVGGAAGKQGSLAQLGLETGYTLGRWLRLPESKVRLLIMCGVAGMIGANYNSPLGSALLIFEVILGEFKIDYFGPIIISSTLATLVYRSLVGNAPKFFAPPYTMRSPDELLWFIVLGIFCGLLGLLYVGVVLQSEAFFRRVKQRVPRNLYLLIPLLGGLGIGTINYLVPLAHGRGTQGINLVLTDVDVAGSLGPKIGLPHIDLTPLGHSLPSVMLFLLLLKLISVFLTMGAWSTGGGFRAGLFTGAMFGASVGYLFEHLAPGTTAPPGTYALLGIGGVFAGFSQAPLTALVITSEMTKDFHLIVPLAITCVVSAYTSKALTHKTLYMARLIQMGYDVFTARRSDILRDITVKDAMVTNIYALEGNLPVREAYQKALSSDFRWFPVLDSKGHLLGMVSLAGLEVAARTKQARLPLEKITPPPVAFLTPSDTLQDAVKKMGSAGMKRLPVVHEEDPSQLVGWLTHHDVFQAYYRELARELEQAGASASPEAANGAAKKQVSGIIKGG
ncbi:chloride channel protein [Ammonifex degensii]|uniref:chloride channel protein n=1 Tax=Ammonifex degensii TaxID=42838 RepID=UPI001FDEA7EA|nr:chloride channel protein [Ammonifex degensii]